MDWHRVVDRFMNAPDAVEIALVGKYVQHKDAYLSVVEALYHASVHHGVKVRVRAVESAELEFSDVGKIVKNKYNKSLFNTYGTQYKMAHYQTTIDVEIKSGLRIWIGKQKVVVKLKPVRVKNGKVFKRPKGKSISSIRVKGNKYQNTYIYLKSKKSRKNDLAFIVLANKDVFIKNIPLNKYIIYTAQGDTWYGTKYLFGPGSRKIKDRKIYDFSRYKWTFNLRSKKKGNMRTDTVEDKDFPR